MSTSRETGVACGLDGNAVYVSHRRSIIVVELRLVEEINRIFTLQMRPSIL